MKITPQVRKKLKLLIKSLADEINDNTSDVHTPEIYISCISEILLEDPAIAAKAFLKIKEGLKCPAGVGYRQAYHLLGLCHQHGLGTPVDDERALACFERVYAGSSCYDCPIPYELANYYLYKACKEFLVGNPAWRENFERMSIFRRKENRTVAENEMEHLLCLIGELDFTGNENVLRHLFKYLLLDKQGGTEKEFDHLLFSENPEKEYVAGLISYFGIGKWVSHSDMTSVMRSSAHKGFAPAQMFLGHYYADLWLQIHNNLVERKFFEIPEHLRKENKELWNESVKMANLFESAKTELQAAVSQGYVPAMTGLARLNIANDPQSTKKDFFQEQLNLYQRAAAKNDPYALLQLAYDEMQIKGKDYFILTKPDREKGIRFLQSAAKCKGIYGISAIHTARHEIIKLEMLRSELPASLEKHELGKQTLFRRQPLSPLPFKMVECKKSIDERKKAGMR
ncbi:MAG: SEL1-like repeat protein [Gammaproteobacteria bacterium]